MKNSENDTKILNEITSYKRKYYLNQALRGLLFLVAILTSVYIIINTLEFSFRFGGPVRAALAFIFLSSALLTFVLYIARPLLVLTGKKKGLTDEQAARMIGNAFPTVSDRLLNLIQLMRSSSNSPLVAASIRQKTGQVANVSFTSAVRLEENKKYLKYALPPIALILALLLFRPAFFTEPTRRIVQFNREFVPEAPFAFQTDYAPYAFKNEDFTISLALAGQAIPLEAYIINEGRKIKLNKEEDGRFSYTFNKIQSSKEVRFEAAGFSSATHQINVVERPNLKNFNVQLVYPRYIGRQNERLSNTGNLEVPEGTTVSWQFHTLETNSATLTFLSDSSVLEAKSSGDNLFETSRKFHVSDSYFVDLENNNGNNKDNILFNVSVIKDRFPDINLNIYQDTLLYSMVALGGNISDDYGITQLSLVYNIADKNGNIYRKDQINLPVNTSQASQGFFYNWDIDALEIKEGDRINYHLAVWDNDGANGRKVTRTSGYVFQVPSRKEVRDEIEQSTEKTEKTIDKSIKDAKSLEKKLKEAEERIKGKKDLDWKDEKLLKEILEEKEKLDQAIEELKQMNQNNSLQRERFTPQDQKLQEKSKQLQELMNELLDDETKKLYEELQKLLEEQSGVEQIQKNLSKLNKKQSNLEKELERTLELFKRMKLEHEINEAVHELDELAKEQNQLSEETEETKTAPEDLLEKQNELNERFDQLKEDLENIRDLNQDLKNPEVVPDQKEDVKEIDREQDRSKDLLEQLDEKIGDKNQSGDKENSGDKEQKEGDKQEGEQEDRQGDNQEQDNSDQQQEGEQKDPGEQQGEENKDGDQDDQQGEQDSGDEQDQQEGGDQQDQPKNKKQIRNQAGQSQKKAGQKMKKMSQEMEQMQAGMEMETMMENMEDLRNIVHNLVKLSFDQEQLMKDFRDVNETDPRFVDLSQHQLKLKDDSQVIQDSLLSLSKRVFQIAAFINKEVDNMNNHMEAAMDALKERRKYKAVGQQQFAMTAMNNLALLLDDVLEQMMNAISEATGKGGKKQNQPIPSLSELQQQLNEKIKDLKESGKTGRELSEELAKLVAEQEGIRKELQEMQRRAEQMNMEENGKKPGQGIPEKMEQTEIDLANKRITEQMIRRQEDILTRLLEAENAMRERELDEERKGETAKQYDKIIPRAFDEYLKQKEKEVEMLKTLPPKLYPYYKREVTEYFRRVGEGAGF